jgi:hypothetical protein
MTPFAPRKGHPRYQNRGHDADDGVEVSEAQDTTTYERWYECK